MGPELPKTAPLIVIQENGVKKLLLGLSPSQSKWTRRDFTLTSSLSSGKRQTTFLAEYSFRCVPFFSFLAHFNITSVSTIY